MLLWLSQLRCYTLPAICGILAYFDRDSQASYLIHHTRAPAARAETAPDKEALSDAAGVVISESLHLSAGLLPPRAPIHTETTTPSGAVAEREG